MIPDIPDELGFPGPDEVAARLAEVAPLHQIGKSRLGEPISMITIGGGERNALVFAGPHPNEPIGFLTVPHLAEHIRDHGDLGYTWHIIGCVDPDGARLNENWYSGPLHRERYLRWFYRPRSDEQVEWAFPDGLPETRALRNVIDSVRPDLMCSLHNAELGGVFYYVSEEHAQLADDLAALSDRTGIPLHTGEAELPGTQRIRPGVFVFPSLETVNEAMPGMSSVHYASRYGTFSLVVEVPLWSDARSSDTTGCGQSHQDVLTEAAAMIEDVTRMPELVTHDSPLARSYGETRITARKFAAALRAHRPPEGEATVAERFGLKETAHMLRLRACATALRVLDGSDHRATRQAVAELLDKWLLEEGSAAQPIPLSKLVATQLGAILSAARAQNCRPPLLP